MIDRKLNILIAYPYLKQTDDPDSLLGDLLRHQSDIRLLLDSGAFTAWKSGKPILLDDYCRYVDTLKVRPWRYFMLDVIGEADKTRKNYEIMLNRGFTPVPIFTRGEDPSVLETYYQTSDVVGIGGLVKTRGNTGFINGIMRHVGTRKCHWLGFVRPEFVLHYKPYMCDSSAWCSPLQFGRIILYLGRGKELKITKKDFTRRPSERICEALRLYGEEPLTLARKDQWMNTSNRVTALQPITYKAALWKTKELEARTGSKVFLACGDRRQIRMFLNAMDALPSMAPSLFRS